VYLTGEELISKIQSFIYALRRGRQEQVLAAVVVVLVGLAVWLRTEWKEMPPAVYAAYAAYGLCGVCTLLLVLRLWRQAAPPPLPPAGPISAAVKGLFPFTVADGALYARLGRNTKLQLLIGLAQNEQVAISVVRGQSGAGKTSLLQAGVGYALGRDNFIYWEAVPKGAPAALLHAVRNRFPDVDNLESLPEKLLSRCVLILDQFEQLSPKNPEHTPVFSLLERVAKAPAPYRLSILVGFRRGFAADWLDFEEVTGFRAEQVAVNLLAGPTAKDTIVVLASEAGFTLDNALVDNLIAEVRQPEGISPVDIAIGVLSLANLVQQRGVTHVGIAEYRLAGGAEGLLQSFVQEKLEEIPEAIRGPLLKGVVLALVDLSSDQRVAEGATAAAIAAKAEMPEGALASSLERLTHPRIRLLEKPAVDRYRLPHERLIPVLRRLTVGVLARRDQVRLVFENEFARWRETRSGRHLLSGRDLKGVLRDKEQFLQDENAAQKAEYLGASLKRRNTLRLAGAAIMALLALAGYSALRLWDNSIQRQKLVSWGLRPELFDARVDCLRIGPAVNDLTWTHEIRAKELDLHFNGSSLSGLKPIDGLSALNLDLTKSDVKSLSGLERLKGLTSVTLKLGGFPDESRVASLTELGQLARLKTLDLELAYSEVTSLSGLEPLKGLTTLTLDLDRSRVTGLSGLEELKGLPTLHLKLSGSPVRRLSGLEHLKGLTTLDLEVGSLVESLVELEQLQGLTTLTLNLSGSEITSLSEVGQLKQLTTLTLDLSDSKVKDLSGLEQLQGLTALALNLGFAPSVNLSALEQLKKLTTLKLDTNVWQAKNIPELQKLEKLTTLTLDITGSQITSMPGLEHLKELTTLTLDLSRSSYKDLSELQQLEKLTALTLYLDGSNVTSVSGLEHLKGLKMLDLDLSKSQVSSLSGLEHLNGLNILLLNLNSSDVTSLSELGKLNGLTALALDLKESHVTSLAGVEQLKGLTKLALDLRSSKVKSLTELVSCNRSSLTKSGYTGEDLIGSFGPDKRFGIFVVLVQVIPNCFFQFTRTAVNTTPDLLSRQQREKAFDQIDPR
jgi:hypothetical protein